MYVYKLKNKINGKVYIGKTINIKQRMSAHFSIAKHILKNKSSQIIHKAIHKYGKENFELEILEKCDSEEESFEKEILWIKFFDSTNPNKGYNLFKGGDGNMSGYFFKIETILKKLEKLFCLDDNYLKIHFKYKKIIRNKKKRNYNISEQHKLSISNANRNKILSENTKLRVSQANSGKNNGMYGKHPTLELVIKTQKSKGNNISGFKVLPINYKTSKIDPKIKEDVIDLFVNKQLTKPQIVDKLNINYNTVHKIIRNHVKYF